MQKEHLRKSLICSHIAASTVAFALLACGGSQPAAAPAAPPPTPMVSELPSASAAPVASAPAPAPEAAVAPPKAAPKFHHHPMMFVVFDAVDHLTLTADQQKAVEGLKTELENQEAPMKEPMTQLANDLADGAAAGKLDKTKIDADTKKLVQASEANTKVVVDAVTKLHNTLDANQRAKVVEVLKAKQEEMREHMGAPGKGPHHHGGPGEAMGPKGAPHGAPPTGDKPKGEPSKAPVPPPAAGPDHDHEHGPHAGPGGHGHGPAMGPDEAIEKLAEDLGLTAEQQKKLKTKSDALMKSEMAAMKSQHEVMEKHMKAILDAFATETFDAQKLGLGEKHGDMVKGMVKGRVAFVDMVLSVITADQRAKFAEHIRQHEKMMCDHANHG